MGSSYQQERSPFSSFMTPANVRPTRSYRRMRSLTSGLFAHRGKTLAGNDALPALTRLQSGIKEVLNNEVFVVEPT